MNPMCGCFQPTSSRNSSLVILCFFDDGQQRASLDFTSSWDGGEDFDTIRRNYIRELRATPESAREKELHEFSVRSTYNNQRIEGSTLTLRETALLLEDRVSPSGKPIGDAKEAEAHANVFSEMLQLKNDLSQNTFRLRLWSYRLC